MSDGVCKHSYLGQTGISLFVPGSGSLTIGLTRIVAFSLLLLNNRRNRIMLNKKAENSLRIMRGLVLPSYLRIVYTIMATDLISGIIDIIFSSLDISSTNRTNAASWVLPIESAVFHCIYEGVAIFLARFGAGTKAFNDSFKIALFWGLITFIVVTIEVRYLDHTLPTQISDKTDIVYIIFMIYCLILLTFYCIFICIPQRFIYRRPALLNYSQFNFALQIYWILAATLIKFQGPDTLCGSAVVGLILIGIIQPLVLWKTIQYDSQYWQGLTTTNPMTEVWDSVDMDTAMLMGELLNDYERGKSGIVPLLHFGQIEVDYKRGFVAGGNLHDSKPTSAHSNFT